MPDITFIHFNGTEQGLEAPEGVSVMQAATGAGVAGIVAECGGSAKRTRAAGFHLRRNGKSLC